MPKKLEVILTVQNEKPSIQFHVSDVVEGPAKEKFMELLKDMPIPEAVLDSLSELSQARFLPAEEVEVQDVPPKFVQQSKPRSGSAQKAKKISDSQLAVIRDCLAQRNISEHDFCARHGVARVEDLTSGAAWHIINERTY